jgi:hypothetical protein
MRLQSPSLATAIMRQADVIVKINFNIMSSKEIIEKMNFFGNLEAHNFAFENVDIIETLQIALENKFSVHLKSLSFRRDFNQSIDNVTLPTGLTTLSMGWDFNQSLDNVKLPIGLADREYLKHIHRSNQPVWVG